VSEGWQALVNAVVVAMVASLALLIFSGASGRNLAISIALGVLAFVVTFMRAKRS